MTREEALQIIWDRCQHSKETEKALEVLKEERPHGEWEYNEGDYRARCSNCHRFNDILSAFCPNCGADMSANDRQVTGKLNEEPKDSHAEYWNSIGEWKEGDEK